MKIAALENKTFQNLAQKYKIQGDYNYNVY